MGLAIAATHPGGPEVLSPIDRPETRPGPGEVALRHTAIGVNFIDTYFRSGLYPWPDDGPLVLGAEAAGIVEEVGEGVIEFRPGQRVAYTLPHGAYSTRRVVPAAALVPLPEGVPDDVAAAAMLKGLTAHYLLTRSYPVQKGDTVLFHAAAGGVGQIAGQWLRELGVRAIGTAGGAEKCAIARAAGYDEVIDYTAGDFAPRVLELTGGRGVAAVYDSVGRDTFRGSLEALATFGTLVSFGQSSGPITDFAVSDLAGKSLSLTRPVLFHFTADRGWLTRAARALFDMIARGALRIEVNQRYPLADAARAHEALEARKTTGSTILIP